MADIVRDEIRAVPMIRVAIFGLCDRDEQHEAHVVIMSSNPGLDGKLVGQDCPGQYVDCRNCDDRKCMGCIFREFDHMCEHDCPMCC